MTQHNQFRSGDSSHPTRVEETAGEAEHQLHPLTTKHEERINAVTHGIGLLCGLVGAAFVVWFAAKRGSAWEAWGCAIYATTLVAVYAASTLSHAFHWPRAQQILRAADQAIIFLFIAGSYTPIALTWLRSGPWWVMHSLVWGIALIGFVSKAVFSHRTRHGSVATPLYILTGLLPLVACVPLFRAIPGGLTAWLMAGGVCYMIGMIFFYLDYRVRYFHAAWHIMVLGGSACHYMGIVLYCSAAHA